MNDRKFKCKLCGQTMIEQYRKGHLWYHRFDVFEELEE